MTSFNNSEIIVYQHYYLELFEKHSMAQISNIFENQLVRDFEILEAVSSIIYLYDLLPPFANNCELLSLQPLIF